jgi:hypothetical protein
MYKFLLIAILFFSSCSTKEASVKSSQKLQKSSSQKRFTIKRPKHQLVVPYSKDIYSTQKYARFMYQKDCRELLFRRADMYDIELKNDPLSVLEVTSEIEKDIKKNHCK